MKLLNVVFMLSCLAYQSSAFAGRCSEFYEIQGPQTNNRLAVCYDVYNDNADRIDLVCVNQIGWGDQYAWQQLGNIRLSDSRCDYQGGGGHGGGNAGTCSYYTQFGFQACLGHQGCDWSTDARECFEAHGRTCAYYTRFGYQACLISSPNCDWSTSARQCFQR